MAAVCCAVGRHSGMSLLQEHHERTHQTTPAMYQAIAEEDSCWWSCAPAVPSPREVQATPPRGQRQSGIECCQVREIDCDVHRARFFKPKGLRLQPRVATSELPWVTVSNRTSTQRGCGSAMGRAIHLLQFIPRLPSFADSRIL